MEGLQCDVQRIGTFCVANQASYTQRILYMMKMKMNCQDFCYCED